MVWDKLEARRLATSDNYDKAIGSELEKSAPPNVGSIGRVDKPELADLYARARGVVFASEDDFGLVPVEAMARGASLIAYRGGGAAETVIDGVTGVFFDAPTVASLNGAILRHSFVEWRPTVIACHTQEYGMRRFVKQMREYIAKISRLNRMGLGDKFRR